MFRHSNLAELGAHRLLELAMILQPASQFRIASSQLQRLRDFRFLVVRCARPEQHQDIFGFLAIHEFPPPEPRGMETSSRTSALSCAKPRAMRDLTVPRGISRISAIWL